MNYNVFVKKIIDDRSGYVTAMFDQNNILFTSSINPVIELWFYRKSVNESIMLTTMLITNLLSMQKETIYTLITSWNRILNYPGLMEPLFRITWFWMIQLSCLILKEIAFIFMNNHKFYNLTARFQYSG